jgi:glycosyltransferase involved in cell wall biosynthesis
MNETEVSLVLPCYNEEKTLEDTVETVEKVLEKEADQYEIIIVEDGCTDSTPQIAGNLASGSSKIKHLHFEERLGKGKALTKGFTDARASKLFFMDTDLATDLKCVKKLLDELEQNDIVIGSRYVEGSEADRGLVRRFLSKGYNTMVRLAFHTGIKDHQCGFKGINKEIFSDIKDNVKSEHWFWDTELLVKAKEKGYKIKEIPVDWEEKEGSEVSVKNSVFYFSKRILTEKVKWIER